ncbi:SGNH/GDSL hydrolase family protein [Nocardioides phosphati]|nr:SGNH/GDSL hydrolase family protein [Nocardioides phosphati]
MGYMKDSTGRRLDSIAIPSTTEVSPTYRYDRLLPWFAALANSSRKRANIVMFGDSLVMGYGLSSWAETLPAQTAAALRARNGITSAGRGFIGANGQVGANHSFWPLQISGGAVYGLGYGPNDYYITLGAAGQKAIDTLSSPVTSFDVVYFAPSSGGSTTGGYYKIDGGTAVTFSTAVTPGLNTLHVAAAANTSIEVGFNAGASWTLFGVTEYKGDENSGVMVHNCGVSGTTAKNWNDYAATGWPAAQKSLSPDLVILDLGTNDSLTSIGNVSSAQFKTNLSTLITNLRKQVSAPLILNAAYNAQNGAAAVEPWANYVAAMRAIEAADSTVVVVDHSARMPAASATDPYSLFNQSKLPHASAKGYALMAATLTQILSPR